MPNRKTDPRTPQQKAADTRKANKAAQQRKAREQINDSIVTPRPSRRAKEAAAQAWQASTGRKRRKEDSDMDLMSGKPAKTQKTVTTGEDDKQPEERRRLTHDKKKYLAPIMEKSDEESESTVVAKVSKSTPDLQGNADTYAVKGYGKSGNDKIKKPDLDVQKGRKHGGRIMISDSSDQEGTDCGNELSSPSHQLYSEDAGDGEHVESDEDDDLKGKDAATIQGILDRECPSWSSPKGPPAKFNDDIIVTEVMDDVIPDKTRQSQKRTRDLALDSGQESSTTSKQKRRVLKSRRQQARDFEKPQWEEPAAKSTKHPREPQVKDEPVDETHVPIINGSKKWPPEASIVYNTSGDLKLTDQHGALAQVIRGAMKIQTKYLMCTDAFPTVAIRTKLTREWLCAATEEEDIEINKIIRERAEKDHQFVQTLQQLIFARIGTLRSSLKDLSVNAVASNYGLDPSDQQMVRKRVSQLLENDMYIFPLREVVTKEGTKLEADVNGPFQHPAIVTVLRDQFFQKSSSPGNVHMACFVSAHETRSEPELPDAMIAFVGTAIYCALCEWKTGTRINLPFTYASYLPVYEGHIETLNNYRTKKPNKCHHGMMELFKSVTINCAAQPARPSSNSALALLNLDDDDDD